MCEQEEQAIHRGISMLYRYNRCVYIVFDGKWHALLALHIKGEVKHIIGLDDAGKPEVVE